MMSALVLIVEDDRDLRKHLKRLLESVGYRVDTAENGQLALDYLNAVDELPKAILLDLMMPVMDGFQFREKQIEIPRLSSIPLAIMTAGGNIEEKQLALKADAAMRKPADISLILAVVERLTAC